MFPFEECSITMKEEELLEWERLEPRPRPAETEHKDYSRRHNIFNVMKIKINNLFFYIKIIFFKQTISESFISFYFI